MRLAALLLVLGAACSTGGTPVAAPTSAAPTTAAPVTSPPALPRVTRTPKASATPARATARAVVASYAFPVAGCRVSYSRAHHDYPATDIFAARGCAFVAPVTGIVDEVSTVDRWDGRDRGADRGGLFVSVLGDDGVRYYGSHLTTVTVRPGTRVRAGTRLGTVGNSGSARGIATHLHFGISWPTGPNVWWVRRGVVNPYVYLRSWQAGGDRSPAVAVTVARRNAGSATPPCRVRC